MRILPRFRFAGQASLMRILHLAYEDPRQPGSGGGSVRTHEVNRRLAERHEVTCIVAGYPGAQERVEDGIRWVPVGPRRAGLLPRLAWFGVMPFVVRARRSDLVVEDFGAPFSTGLSPLYTRRPVVAMVQWMFAREMRAKYHLPFDLVERYGVRAYDDLITVSDWLARDVVRRNPRAIVEAIPNGLGAEAFAVPETAVPEHFAFLGRLDIGHKGLDMLVEAVAEGLRRTGGELPPVLVLGDGPDRAALEGSWSSAVSPERSGWWVAWRVSPRPRLLARSHAVLMPSRYETFGIVAAEALAAGVPLVTFDVGPLREVTGGHGTALVPPFDMPRFVDEMLAVLDDPTRRHEAATSGREWSRRYDWDVIAAKQERHYLAALERHRRRLRDDRGPGGRRGDDAAAASRPPRRQPSPLGAVERFGQEPGPSPRPRGSCEPVHVAHGCRRSLGQPRDAGGRRAAGDRARRTRVAPRDPVRRLARARPGPAPRPGDPPLGQSRRRRGPADRGPGGGHPDRPHRPVDRRRRPRSAGTSSATRRSSLAPHRGPAGGGGRAPDRDDVPAAGRG